MAECLTPLSIKHKHTGEYMDVPCGKCPTCFARRVSQWSFRLVQQDKVATSAYFITLTYDTQHVPISKNGFMTLQKRCVQLFLKRLRKSNKQGIKYFAAGEYGGRTNRPHYHIILFNAKLETIQPAWGLGHVHYGEVSAASIGYTLKYISKASRIPMHSRDDRVKEFALMSKGLGANYLTDAMRRWHLADLTDRMYCNLPDGKKIGMPRYYKQKVYNETQRKIAGYYARKKTLEDRREVDERTKIQAHIAAFQRFENNRSKADKL